MWRGGLFGASIILSFLMPAASLKVLGVPLAAARRRSKVSSVGVGLVQRTAKALKAEL
jgi:hypothetical protein